MNIPKISAIAVISRNRGVGKDNGLLFHVPGDLPRFKRITSGHPIIMGRKTFESREMNKRALPNRTNIVVTRDSSYQAEGVVVFHSLDEAIDYAVEMEQKRDDSAGEVFIIGGGQIYKEAMPRLDKLYLTVVEKDVEADVFFPDYSDFNTVVSDESREAEGLSYRFLDLVKG